MAKGPKTPSETSIDDRSLQIILSNRVREVRRRLKLPQHELGTLIGTSQAYIFLVESAEANITLKTLMRLAQALKVNPVDLLTENNTLPILDDTKTRELAALVETSLQEVRATTRYLTKIDEILHKVHALLTKPSEDPKESATADG